MFSIFKKKSEEQRLTETYQKLLAESHKLSTTNRARSDQKFAEAEAIKTKLEKISPN